MLAPFLWHNLWEKESCQQPISTDRLDSVHLQDNDIFATHTLQALECLPHNAMLKIEWAVQKRCVKIIA